MFLLALQALQTKDLRPTLKKSLPSCIDPKNSFTCSDIFNILKKDKDLRNNFIFGYTKLLVILKHFEETMCSQKGSEITNNSTGAVAKLSSYSLIPFRYNAPNPILIKQRF